jgi:LysM repeat protein
VQGGENPSYIAALYGVTVDELIAANNIEDVRMLTVGQELVVPHSTLKDSGGAADNLPPLVVYVIKEGDTLLDIALRYGTSIEAISSLNPNTNLDLIYPGQELVVPIATPTPTSTPTATLTPTATQGPPYQPPQLLSPAAGQVVDQDTMLFNWTATGLLAEDEFYVVQLVWPDGSYTEQWTRSNAWRVTRAQRPAPGPVSWSVAIMRRTGAAADGAPQGVPVVEPGERRIVEWP